MIQTDDYYPFGLTYNSYSRENNVKQDYLYNGKEKQDELGLDWLDYGARMYMPEVGRWGVVDPLSDRRLWVSPYNYVQNNPISRFDPTGMLDDYAMDTETGNINLIKKTNDKTDKLVDKKTNKVIASKVEKGLLKDGQNIKQNGLETSKVKSGIELVVTISMHIEQEITGTVYGSDDGKKNYLKVEPYKNAKKVIGKDNNDFYMTTGVSSKIEKFFKSSDRKFSGKAVAAFHTNPGLTGFPQFGTTEASEGDEEGILANFIHNGGLNIPFFIFAKHKMTSGNITSNIARYKYDSWKGVERRLLPQSHGVELEKE